MYLVAVLCMLSAAAAVSINGPKPPPPPLAQTPSPQSPPLDINEVQHLNNHDGYKDGGAKEVTEGDVVTSLPLKVSEAHELKEPPQNQFEIDGSLNGNGFEAFKKGDASKELNKQHNFNDQFNPDDFRQSDENDRKDFEPEEKPTDLPPLVKKPSRISKIFNWLFNLIPSKPLPFRSSRDNQNHDDIGDHFKHTE